MAKFVNPASVIGQVDLRPGQVVADFGCGAGFYTIPAAKQVGEGGHVYALDIMPDRLAATMSSATAKGLRNVSVLQVDLEKPILDIKVGACDVVVVSSILHIASNREAVLHNAYAVLKTGGLLLVVEWKADVASTFGPKPEKRISKSSLDKLVLAKGLKFVRELEVDGQHYAMLYHK